MKANSTWDITQFTFPTHSLFHLNVLEKKRKGGEKTLDKNRIHLKFVERRLICGQKYSKYSFLYYYLVFS